MRAVARRSVAAGACIGVIALTTAQAQTATLPSSTNGRGLTIAPSLTITETLTNNVNPSGTDRRGDLVSEVTPGIRLNSTGGRVKGFLDYSLSGIAYARNSGNNDIQNSLNAAVSVEAVEKRAFVDVNANISQQAISAFGTRTADSSLINNNRTEVRTLSVSPYVRGRLASFADYEARFTQTWTRNSTTETANNDNSVASLRIAGDSGPQLLTWSADASHLAYDYRVGRRTIDDTARGVLYVAADPQLRLSLIEGWESNNIASSDRQTHSTPGFGAEWYPTERTQLKGQYEKRFFGSSHSLLFTHRTPHTVWKYSDVQDISTGFGQPVLGSVGTAFDLFFAQFASIQPDPVLRASLVDAFLRAIGIAPNTQIFSGSLSSAVTRQRRQELSFALLGVRDTVTFAATQVQGLRLDNTSAVTDDFANGNLLKQRGLSVTLSHRLSPSAALNLLTSIDHTAGNLASQSSTLRSVNLYWTDQLGPHINVSLGARHSSFSSPSQPYSETGVTATVAMRF